MNVGATISKIRRDNNMTQEDFAQLFHVTRQTISNWENEKSYPDLQTLVDISNKFDISLDKILKEDISMVRTIDKEVQYGKLIRKYSQKIKMVFLSLGLILMVIGSIYTNQWNSRKEFLETKFQNAAKDQGFQYNEQLGYYVLAESNNIKFTLPNQSMPDWWDFSFDFYAQYLDCYVEFDEYTLQIRWSENNDMDIWLLDEKGDMVAMSSAKANQIVEANQSQISELSSKGNEIYQCVYQ